MFSKLQRREIDEKPTKLGKATTVKIKVVKEKFFSTKFWD